ncbi:DGQHR domain-containing protein [Variovorax rhizosphaerae]|uniref:DGQHR domain-containing protein n=1 Tax=Variovorax rhizosphaerae TaxID=1836200 RepID=A0ABU8WRW8_9BURK
MASKLLKTNPDAPVTVGARVRYSASLIQQGAKQFFSLTMPTNVLAKCCFVTSRHEDPQAGFQRVLDAKRAKDIADYIDSGAGTIPGSIILSAQPDANFAVVGGGKTAEFTFTPKSFLVLDGQHRVYGFSLASSAFRVPVVVYSGLSHTEEARLFIDINTKQRAVPNELLLDIKQLAQRENDRDVLLRETFDLFAAQSTSTLLGLMSPSSRQSNKISRVTFGHAFRSALSVFSSPTPESVFEITNAYLAAFADVLEQLGLHNRITSPAVFRAIMNTFPEVARISAAQHGKSFNKAKFAAVINPIADQLTASKFDKAAISVKTLSELLAGLIKKDFSI